MLLEDFLTIFVKGIEHMETMMLRHHGPIYFRKAVARHAWQGYPPGHSLKEVESVLHDVSRLTMHGGLVNRRLEEFRRA